MMKNFAPLKLPLWVAPVFVLVAALVALVVVVAAINHSRSALDRAIHTSVDQEAQAQLPVIRIDDLERFENRLDPETKAKWQEKVKNLPPPPPPSSSREDF